MTTRVLVRTYVFLMLLFALTWGLSYLPLDAANMPVSLAIACAKLALVALYFMNLRQATSLERLGSALGVFWLGILLTLTFSDYLSRGWLEAPSPWPQGPLNGEISRPLPPKR